MNTDRNLLFAVLALQADFLDPDQFIKACTLWTTRKHVALPQLLIELGWMNATERSDVERLLERTLRKYGGEARAGLAVIADDVKRSLAALDDDDIQRTLCDLPDPDAPTTLATIHEHISNPRDRYSVSRLHASGGIGRIWVARDLTFGRNVALKELRPERASLPAHRARFLQEARITGQLEHPGIVPVYELAVRAADQEPFYTMRFVKGRTLSEAARAWHQTRRQAQGEMLDLLPLLNAFITVCNTIAYAHSRRVIHRDLKGENVVMGDFGEVVVLDWGLAKLVDQKPEADAASLDADNAGPIDIGLTMQGQAMGTPAYMAPEQASGRVDIIDRCTDIYGLGAILYEVLTGDPPFSGQDTEEVLRKVREEPPRPPRERWPDVPPALESICMRALAKQPKDRFASASELATAVQSWQEVERREAQEERDRFFTLSLDMLNIAGFDGYFKRVNPAFERTLGYTVEEVLAAPYLSFIHPDDVERTIAEAQKIASGTGTVTFENRYRCKDGSYRWFLWTATPYPTRQLIYSAAKDITDRKLAEEALRKGAERYRSVITAMQDGILVLDADGSIRTCNPSAERILGLTAEQIIGRTAVDPRWRAIHDDGSPFPSDAFPVAETLRTGQPCSNVVMGVYKPDDTLTWISINSEPAFEADGTTLSGVVASFEDITERRRLEEALRQASTELAILRHGRPGEIPPASGQPERV
ncbi:MAG TPA: PAS domain S-box protein [Vicinamibacterales bacterium]|nr:PAS domain S-box protein [Vicinamibacterales bacterium]